MRGPKGKRFHEKLFPREGFIGDDTFRYMIYEEDFVSSFNSKKRQ